MNNSVKYGVRTNLYYNAYKGEFRIGRVHLFGVFDRRDDAECMCEWLDNAYDDLGLESRGKRPTVVEVAGGGA